MPACSATSWYMPLPLAAVLSEAQPMRVLLFAMTPAAAFWLKGRDTQPSATLFVHCSSPAFGSRFSATVPMAAAPVRRLFVLLVPLLLV